MMDIAILYRDSMECTTRCILFNFEADKEYAFEFLHVAGVSGGITGTKSCSDARRWR